MANHVENNGPAYLLITMNITLKMQGRLVFIDLRIVRNLHYQ